MKTFTRNNTEFFTHCTQKTAADYLNNRFHLPKKYFLDFIRKTKNAGYVWDVLRVDNEKIMFSFFYNGKLAYFTIEKDN